jgi:small subunit ribosomal protein S6
MTGRITVREYELVYIIQPDASPEREKEIQSRVDDIISRNGGTTLHWDDWGKRKLAYEIKKFQKGHYLLVTFLGMGQFIPEIERVLRLDPDILRFLTVKTNESVKDVAARLERAKEEEVERAKKREERERLEAQRAEREAQARSAAARQETQETEASQSGGDRGEVDTPEDDE